MYLNQIPTIKYEGAKSKNPLAFKFYNPDEVILGKPMKDHLKFSVAYWHTFTGTGVDPFGQPTVDRPWDEANTDPMERAKVRVAVAFELMEKLGIEYFCFHDRDIAPEADTLAETNQRLDTIVALIEQQMQRTGIKLLWGTANLFSNKRFMHGAATSPNADVFAFAGAQVKKALEITHRLGGAGYVFWGGREGYETLLNTDMLFEQTNLARLLRMAVNYAKELGFKGQFYIEPKPKEPTKHQYDFDVATVLAFLQEHRLEKDFKINIETNHATLSGHTMQHELRTAADRGMLGSVDANQGDLLLGWDTDQFPTNIYDAIFIMYEILRAGGLTTGGLNFDAKLRRSSYLVEDMFHAHIAGMDTFAIGLRIAARLIEDRVFESYLEERYASYKAGIGKDIIAGTVTLKELETYVLNKSSLTANPSGQQEYLEAIVNQYLLGH